MNYSINKNDGETLYQRKLNYKRHLDQTRCQFIQYIIQIICHEHFLIIIIVLKVFMIILPCIPVVFNFK